MALTAIHIKFTLETLQRGISWLPQVSTPSNTNSTQTTTDRRHLYSKERLTFEGVLAIVQSCRSYRGRANGPSPEVLPDKTSIRPNTKTTYTASISAGSRTVNPRHHFTDSAPRHNSQSPINTYPNRCKCTYISSNPRAENRRETPNLLLRRSRSSKRLPTTSNGFQRLYFGDLGGSVANRQWESSKYSVRNRRPLNWNM